MAEEVKREKPVPSLRSKDSFKKATAFFAAGSKDQSTPIKPVPAKRRIVGVVAKLENKEKKEAPKGLIANGAKRNWAVFETVDIEKSTAVGFTRLLRTSDSGSEEFLQNKTFPNDVSRSMSNDDVSSERGNSCLTEMSPSLSDELILSSNDSSLDQLESGINLTFDTSANSSSFCERERDGSLENLVDLPIGWKRFYDKDTKQIYYTNSRGDKVRIWLGSSISGEYMFSPFLQWFSSNDSEGKIYFFEENSNESYWELPKIQSEPSKSKVSNRRSVSSEEYLNSRILEEESEAAKGLQLSNWPQLFHGNMVGFRYKSCRTAFHDSFAFLQCILKEGPIDRTKITENGKKLKKSWSTSYAVLTELFLLFFKDAKAFSAMVAWNFSSISWVDCSKKMCFLICRNCSARRNQTYQWTSTEFQ